MTDFVMQSPVTDGEVCFDELWNQAVVRNTLALYERLPVFYPYRRVANTLTETELYRHTIPAGSLGPNGAITTELSGVCQNASGTSGVPLLSWYLDGVFIFAATVNIASSAYRIPFRAALRVQNLNNTAAQLATRELAFGGTPSPSGVLISLSYNGAWKELAIDTATAHSLIVTWRWDVLHTSCIFDMLCAHVIGPIYQA